MPRTKVHCLFDDGINVRKCSNLVDYRTASILPWERNNGYLSPPSMVMVGAKFQRGDLAAGLLGGRPIEERSRSKLIYPDQFTRQFFCQKLDSGKAENQIVEVERKLLC